MNDCTAALCENCKLASSLQHAGTYSNTLQHTATPEDTQSVAIHCNTLQQYTATYCNNTLQHTATPEDTRSVAIYCVNTATHCNTLQHHCVKWLYSCLLRKCQLMSKGVHDLSRQLFAVWCGVLQRVAAFRSVLKCIARLRISSVNLLLEWLMRKKKLSPAGREGSFHYLRRCEVSIMLQCVAVCCSVLQCVAVCCYYL